MPVLAKVLRAASYGSVVLTLVTAPLGLSAQAASRRVISCGNLAGDQVQCKTAGYATNVRLVRDRGPVQCRQGSNWGSTDSFVWTNKGCGGDFEITYRVATPTPVTRIIQCGSRGGGDVSCNPFGTVESVRLLRELSRRQCRQGSTWGFSSAEIWTKGRCHGEFEVTYRSVAQPR